MLSNWWRCFLLACVSSFCMCFLSCSTLKVYCIHTGLWHVKLAHFCPGALKQVGLYKGHFSQPPNSNLFFFLTNKQIVQLKSSIFQKTQHCEACHSPHLKGKIHCFYFESDVAQLPGLLIDPSWIQHNASERKLLASRHTKGVEGPAAMGIKLYYTTVTASRTVSRAAVI